ncbi:hypothetical protein D3C80_528730 [compost metagenome]
MQELQPRLQLPGWQIAVQRQVERGVGVAVGVGLGLHVEQHAEIALADEGNPLGDQLQRAGFGGHATDLGQSDIPYRQQPLQQGVRVVHQRLILEYRQLQITVPKPGFWLACLALGAGLVVIGVGAQPAGVEAAAVAVLPINRQATFGVDVHLVRDQVLSYIDDFQHLLAGHGVDALRARAIVPQPLMVEGADAIVGPLHQNTVRQGLHGSQRADQRIGTKVGKGSGGVHGDLLVIFLGVMRSLGQCTRALAGPPVRRRWLAAGSRTAR